MSTDDATNDSREARRKSQRPPETYETVGEWWSDYQGFVPIQMAAGLAGLMKDGMSFHDAYLFLLGKGAIIEIEPPDRSDPDNPRMRARLDREDDR